MMYLITWGPAWDPAKEKENQLQPLHRDHLRALLPEAQIRVNQRNKKKFLLLHSLFVV
jgi:hypothetical protein